MSLRAEEYAWSESEEGEVHQRAMRWVECVERENDYIFDRFVKLAWLYDPDRRPPDAFQEERNDGRKAIVQENVIADNCDTVTGIIATKDVRARFMTDDADWKTQRRAKRMELYAEQVEKLLKLPLMGQRVFHDCSLKATGVGHVYIDRFHRVCAERVMVDEIVVDPQETNGNYPFQMVRRRMMPKKRLKMMYPEHADAIDAAISGGSPAWAYWADYRPINRDEVVFLQLWYLPVGEPDDEGYQPGRYVACIKGVDLDDREYDKPYFPFAVMKWTESPDGFYGVGGARRIAGQQRVLNKANWQIDRQIDQYAVPTTWVHQTDQNMQLKTVNQFGTMGVYKMKEPKTVFPPAVSPETYKRREDAINSANRTFGQITSPGSMNPAGLESGVALREYREQTTDRFAPQEKAHEDWRMEMLFLALAAYKELSEMGIEPPDVTVRSRSGAKKLSWADVDMKEVRVQIMPASTMSRTPAGRLQTVMEYAQAGIISQDEARRLSGHPDLERALSLYNAALEYVEFSLQDILDGGFVAPSTEMNLKMCVWRGEAQYQLSAMNGAPESVMENLHTFVVLAAYEISLQDQAANQNMMAANVGASPAAPPMGPGMPPGMDPTMMPPGGGLPPGAPGGSVSGAGVMPLQLAG